MGTVVVIASGGTAYEAMAEAWLVSWRRQHVPGLTLLLARGGGRGQGSVRTLAAPAAAEVTTGAEETLVPGVLEKTLACLRLCPPGWVFRTNLSSHIDLARLAPLMASLPDGWALGFSPGRDHLCGAGIGLSPGAARLLVEDRGELDRSLLDDLAISRLLQRRGCGVRWTGRFDRVWPDGVVLHGGGPLYHVRAKTLDRDDDARALALLARFGLEDGLRRIFSGP